MKISYHIEVDLPTYQAFEAGEGISVPAVQNVPVGTLLSIQNQQGKELPLEGAF